MNEVLSLPDINNKHITHRHVCLMHWKSTGLQSQRSACSQYFEVHFPQLELPVIFLLFQATDGIVQLTNLLLEFVYNDNRQQMTRLVQIQKLKDAHSLGRPISLRSESRRRYVDLVT